MSNPSAAIRRSGKGRRLFWFLLAILAVAFAGIVGFVAMMPSGGKVTPPYAHYEAHLENYSAIEEVEKLVKDLAMRWQLGVNEKDRGQMAFLTRGKPALFIALYFDGEPVLNVTNVGVGDKVVVVATDYGEMPLSDLEKLTQDVLKELETLGLEFHRVEESQEPKQ